MEYRNEFYSSAVHCRVNWIILLSLVLATGALAAEPASPAASPFRIRRPTPDRPIRDVSFANEVEPVWHSDF